jgi:hypothetical protein
MTVYDKIARGDYENRVHYSPEYRDMYRDVSHRLNQEFKDDLEQEFGLVGHKKAQLLFDLAWEQGHANGNLSVLYHYELMSVLLERV